MPFDSHASFSGVENTISAFCAGGPGSRRNVIRFVALALASASLAACAQSSVVSNRSAFHAPTRQASVERHQGFRFASAPAHESVVRRHEPSSDGASTHVASRGMASFYTEGTKTASGEKFDTHEMTAAHPSLPFGTRLRVTNVSTGKSVTVRVNDRGPFVHGRVVDVSYSAAQALGMVNSGVANVKVDVVQ
jgi:rare lipoprotein A